MESSSSFSSDSRSTSPIREDTTTHSLKKPMEAPKSPHPLTAAVVNKICPILDHGNEAASPSSTSSRLSRRSLLMIASPSERFKVYISLSTSLRNDDNNEDNTEATSPCTLEVSSPLSSPLSASSSSASEEEESDAADVFRCLKALSLGHS